MIVATAGHVDHGKTALIKQLTGVDTDRLEEEKRRGLTINLGYAYLPREQGAPLGFIDVPGHRRFINTMIAGISGIDMAMLVVAADEGPMPQTLEHLDILQVLGVAQLVVVITRIDRVDATHLEMVRAAVADTLRDRPWTAPGIFAVSNVSGEGIEELRAHLLGCSAPEHSDPADQFFHISVDRSFTLKGSGLIVTGTVVAGSVTVGDTLTLQPGGNNVRVRALRVHDQAASEACAGQRCALNISTDTHADDIQRGDWLLSAGAGDPTTRVDVRFDLLPQAPFSLRAFAPVKLCIGAKRVAGRLHFLTDDKAPRELRPGDGICAQIVLEEAICCMRGQTFIVRDHAEDCILGGGTILDPHGPNRRRCKSSRMKVLQALSLPDPATCLRGLLEHGEVVCLQTFSQDSNLRPGAVNAITPGGSRAFDVEDRHWLVSETQWCGAQKAQLDHVQQWHTEHPREAGIQVRILNEALAADWPQPLQRAVLVDSIGNGRLELAGGLIREHGRKAQVSVQEQRHWEVYRQCLAGCGNRIPLVSEAVEKTGVNKVELENTARRAVKAGALVKVSARRYALPRQMYALAQQILELDDAGQEITVATMKQRWQTGRNLAVEILEYFDSIRFTVRQGQTRTVLDAELPARLFQG